MLGLLGASECAESVRSIPGWLGREALLGTIWRPIELRLEHRTETGLRRQLSKVQRQPTVVVLEGIDCDCAHGSCR